MRFAIRLLTVSASFLLAACQSTSNEMTYKQPSSAISMTSEHREFALFVQRLRQNIPSEYRNIVPRGTRVEIDLGLRMNGEVASAKIIVPSQYPHFNQIILRAAANAGPLPAPSDAIQTHRRIAYVQD